MAILTNLPTFTGALRAHPQQRTGEIPASLASPCDGLTGPEDGDRTAVRDSNLHVLPTGIQESYMHRSTSAILAAILCAGLILIGPAASKATAQPMAKAQVASLITKVENGVDEFRNYLEKRGENASDAQSNAQASGRRRGQGATDNQKAKANAKKDALDDALGDLNRSTNKLRRKFDATDKWIETKSQVQSVVDDGRKINQVVARGNYGADAAKLWAALRTSINDLARAYGVQPLAI
jgi:hypothetical protein